MVGIFRYQHVRQQAWTGQATFEGRLAAGAYTIRSLLSEAKRDGLLALPQSRARAVMPFS